MKLFQKQTQPQPENLIDEMAKRIEERLMSRLEAADDSAPKEEYSEEERISAILNHLDSLGEYSKDGDNVVFSLKQESTDEPKSDVKPKDDKSNDDPKETGKVISLSDRLSLAGAGGQKKKDPSQMSDEELIAEWDQEVKEAREA